jgi:hypothetical protein
MQSIAGLRAVKRHMHAISAEPISENTLFRLGRVVHLYHFCSTDDIPLAQNKNIEVRLESWEAGIMFDVKERQLPLSLSDTSPPYLIQNVATLITTANPAPLVDLLRLKDPKRLAFLTSRAHVWVESCFHSIREPFEFSILP